VGFFYLKMGLFPSWQDIKGSAQGWKNILSGQTWQGNAPIHSGSWGGLPDFGITEIHAAEPESSIQQSTQYQTPLNYTPAPSGSSSGDMGSLIQDYKNRGWTDENAIIADINATGGTSGGGGETYDPYAQLRGEISSGWDAYINSLNQMLEQGLPSQRTAQEGIAQSQYGKGENILGTQLGEGRALLGQQRERTQKNQAKTLRDLTENIRNLFRTGNVMLGARGAGDSSAANQYSYALTKMGSKQRSDIMSQGADIMAQIDARETNLKNIYDSEIRNLGFDRDAKLNQIAEWFSTQQMQLQQAQAQGQLGKSQDLANLSKDILTQAQNALARVDQDVRDRYSALQQWAMGVSNNIGELRSNMQKIAQFAPNLPGFTPVAGQPQVDP